VGPPPWYGGIRCCNPECGRSVSPASHVAEAIDDLELEEGKQPIVELPGSLVVRHPDDNVVDAEDLHHLFLSLLDLMRLRPRQRSQGQ
jgi:hypothetical protein